ncbi:MAG: hypothetical protein ACFFCS_26845 [Candidatus Hodarchaeota archaeon]
MGDFETMKQAYSASSKILKKKMERERKADFQTLNQIMDNEIIIIRGTYDRIEDVFDILKIPYGLMEDYQFEGVNIRPTQTLIINCPGDGFSKKSLEKIKDFVKEGGFLLTTDWVLKNVLEKIFPDHVKFNEQSTRDDVVKVEIVDKSSPYLKGMFEKDAEPLWWLESTSYPIKILRPNDVKVLIQSREMKKKYGESPIVITFNYEKGTVLHMTSHYYLQRTELRSDRHKKSAKEYAVEEMGLSKEEIAGDADFDDLSLAEAESAYTSQQFIVNTMVERKKKVEKMEDEEEQSKED